MRTRVTFDEVSYRATKSGVCSCGKRASRSEKFWQTLNPFNKNATGSPKTRDEILNELKESAQAWRNAPVRHARCE